MAKNTAMSLQDRIKEAYKTQKQLNVSDLEFSTDLTAIIGLLALLRSWSAEKLDHVQPLDSIPNILCPTVEMTSDTVSNIYRVGLINVDLSNSPVEAFVENADQSISWYNYRTALIPSLQTSDHVLDIPETISFLQSLIPNGLAFWQKKQLPELMRKIAVAECVQYHRHILNEYNFKEPISEKTELIFAELLDTMSVSHILPCIWSSAKSAAAFLQTLECKGRKHAYNTIQGKIRETAAKRLSGELQNKLFDRGIGCERSELSIELYTALGFDADIGFTKRIADIEIPEAWKAIPDDAEYETGAIFTTYEKLLLEEASFYECTDSWWERPLACMNREVIVRKLPLSPHYEVRVMDVSNVHEPARIASAMMDDFTGVVVFTDALEKGDNFERMMQQIEVDKENR